jgi:hypothetical protein
LAITTGPPAIGGWFFFGLYPVLGMAADGNVDFSMNMIIVGGIIKFTDVYLIEEIIILLNILR